MPATAPTAAVLHVGAPKTGTTWVQQVLWSNQAALRAAGVEVLGSDQGQHYRAGKDLRGLVFDPDDPGPDWTGAWQRMADRSRESSADVVVVTDEHLASASSQQIEHAVATLRPRAVEVVYTARDLASLLPSEWQEFVKHGSTAAYQAWASEVLEQPRVGPGEWFWSVHDAPSVLARWAEAVGGDHTHLVPMPPSGAPADELWRRFASVLGVDPAVAVEQRPTANPSLGLAETEVLRQTNAALPPEVPAWHRTGLVRDVLANGVLNPLDLGGRPRLPERLVALVAERAESIQRDLRRSGCDVVGDLDDLSPRLDRLQGSDDPTAEQLLEVSVAGIVGLVREMARMRDDRRASERRLRDALNDAEYRAQHPVRVRVEDAKGAVVRAEGDHRLVASSLRQYRRARDLLG